MSRSTQRHNLNKLGWAGSPRSYMPSFVEIRPPVPEKIFKGFYHIWAWQPSRSCDPGAVNKLSSPLPKEAPHKIGFNWTAVSEKKVFENVNGWNDVRRTPDHGYTKSSPMSLRLR